MAGGGELSTSCRSRDLGRGHHLRRLVLLVILASGQMGGPARVEAPMPFEEHGSVVAVGFTDDVHLFVGDTLELRCDLAADAAEDDVDGGDDDDNDASKDVPSLYFVRNTRTVRQERLSQYSAPVSRTSLRLSLSDLSLEDEGAYQCYQDVSPMGVDQQQLPILIGHKSVRIDNRPTAVSYESCRVYHWQEMTCTWDLAVNFRHPEFVRVALGYTFSGTGLSDCPQLTNTSCHWDASTYQHGHIYYVQVNVSYADGGDVLDHSMAFFGVKTAVFDSYPMYEDQAFMIDIKQALVEPAPVSRLWAEPINHTCLQVTWDWAFPLSQGIHEDLSVTFVLRLWPVSSVAASGLEATCGSFSEDESVNGSLSHDVTLCDLEPYTRYTAEVAARPYSMDTLGYYSNWTLVTAWTEQGVPIGAPAICSGCYHELPAGSVNSTNASESGTRNVRILFQEIEEYLSRGDIVRYVIEYSSLSSKRWNNNDNNHLTVAKTPGNPVVYADVELPAKTEDFIVKIAGATIKGVSGNASSIIVLGVGNKETKTEGLRTAELVVEHTGAVSDGGRLFLFWVRGERSTLDTKEYGHEAGMSKRRSVEDKAARPGLRPRSVEPGHAGVSSRVLVWCVGNRLQNKCKSHLNWTSVPDGLSTMKLDTGIRGVDVSDILIGETVEQHLTNDVVVSSGIAWSDCIYLRGAKPGEIPKNTRVFQLSGEGTARVLWEKPACTWRSPYITSHMVSYCPRDNRADTCNGASTSHTVAGAITSLTLTGLAGGLEYLILVQAMTSAGVGPPASVTLKLQAFSGQVYTDWVIFVGVFLLLASVGIVAAFLIRRYSRKKQKGSLVLDQVFRMVAGELPQQTRDADRNPSGDSHQDDSSSSPLLPSRQASSAGDGSVSPPPDTLGEPHTAAHRGTDIDSCQIAEPIRPFPSRDPTQVPAHISELTHPKSSPNPTLTSADTTLVKVTVEAGLSPGQGPRTCSQSQSIAPTLENIQGGEPGSTPSREEIRDREVLPLVLTEGRFDSRGGQSGESFGSSDAQSGDRVSSGNSLSEGSVDPYLQLGNASVHYVDPNSIPALSSALRSPTRVPSISQDIPEILTVTDTVAGRDPTRSDTLLMLPDVPVDEASDSGLSAGSVDPYLQLGNASGHYVDQNSI